VSSRFRDRNYFHDPATPYITIGTAGINPSGELAMFRQGRLRFIIPYGLFFLFVRTGAAQPDFLMSSAPPVPRYNPIEPPWSLSWVTVHALV
jgi:hypothetical protein